MSEFEKAEQREIKTEEEIIKSRHTNALVGVKVEQLLSQEIYFRNYPTTNNSSVEKIRSEAMDLIQRIHEDSPEKYFGFRKAINDYLAARVRTTREEINFCQELNNQGKEFTDENLGEHIFYLKTGENPVGEVRAQKKEAYFVIECYEDADKMKLFEEDEEYFSKVGGFHYEIFSLGDKGINVVFINYHEKMSDPALVEQHERQHFLNNTVLKTFFEIESMDYSNSDYSTLDNALESNKEFIIKRALREVKDELIARIREELSAPERCTNFLGKEIYEYLSRQFTRDELLDMEKLMKDISAELKKVFFYFTSAEERTCLVYHLSDVPLTKMPQRLESLANFFKDVYSNNELENYIPPLLSAEEKAGLEERQVLNLEGLSMCISDIIYRKRKGVVDLDFDSANFSAYKDEDLVEVRRLNEEYNELYKQLLG